MTTVSVTQINPSDSITSSGANLPHNEIAAVVNGNLDDNNIASLSGTKITGSTIPVAAFDANTNPETRTSETSGNFVASGGVWSATTGLGGTMTAAIVYIAGKRISAPSVASKTFTASKDTYASIDNTGAAQYTEVTNGAVSPSLPSNNVWTYKVVTNGSAVTSVSDVRVRSPLALPTPLSVTVATNESTASTTFADLATTTDTVTFTPGPSGMALIIVSSALSNDTSAQAAYVGFTLSSGNTLAAADTRTLKMRNSTGAPDNQASYIYTATGLTASPTVVKLKYRVTGGTGSFSNRSVTVVPV